MLEVEFHQRRVTLGHWLGRYLKQHSWDRHRHDYFPRHCPWHFLGGVEWQQINNVFNLFSRVVGLVYCHFKECHV